MNHAINEKNHKGYNFYLFLDSVVQENNFIFEESWNLDALNLSSDFERCDYRKLGGAGFYEDGVGYNVTDVAHILSITGSGHILRVATSNEGNLNQNSRGSYTASRTLTGMIKLLHEWSVVSREPFNNEEKVSNCAVSFLNNINLNENIISDILSGTGDMVLARYIRGDTERSLEKETQSLYDMPDSFKQYLKSHYTYSNIYDLDNILNLNIFSVNEMIEYRLSLEKIIFDYFYEKGIDIENFENMSQVFELDITTSRIKHAIAMHTKLEL